MYELFFNVQESNELEMFHVSYMWRWKYRSHSNTMPLSDMIRLVGHDWVWFLSDKLIFEIKIGKTDMWSCELLQDIIIIIVSL